MSPLTTAGAIVGTIQYMSPEQIEGKEADARSDLFALGAVLYEMLTGARPFEGKSQISVASAILEKDPEPVSVTQPLTPPTLEHVINALLAKNPEDRFQTAHDIRLQLGWIAKHGVRAAPTEKIPAKSTRLPWVAAAVVSLLLIAFIFYWHTSLPSAQTTFYAAPLPFAAQDLAVAPNGHTVALVGYLESEHTNTLWIYEPG